LKESGLKHLKPILLCIALAVASLSALAQGERNITMNMQDAEIRALIQWMADKSGKNFVVHRDVKGSATVVSAEPVSLDEAWQMFLQVLELNGYAAVSSGQSVKVLPAPKASQSAGNADASLAGDIKVSIIRLQHVPAQELSVQLKPLMSEAGVITAYSQTNALIVSDRGDNIERIRRLSRQIDQSGDSSFDLVKLKHADAFELLKSVSGLMSEELKQSGLAVSMSVDQRSNAILLAGNSYQRTKVKKLVQQLDKPMEATAGTQVIYLHYVDAEELVPVLRGTLDHINEDSMESSTPASVEASKAANALVINAPPAIQARIKRVIKQLDIRRAQVLVEALIVDVMEDDGRELGISWITSDLAEENRTGGFAANNTTGALGIGSTIADSDGEIIDVIPGAGLSFGYIKDGDLRAVFRALSTKTRSNVISTPSVVALDNEEASLLVGQNVPFVTGQSTGAASQTDNPFTTVQRQDIGTTLKITPRINRGDSVTLKIEQTTERINNEASSSAVDLVTNKRQILTNALIRDGEILVLGGLISDEESDLVQKTPLLGDLPILGHLFRSKGKLKQKTNLMVFIHPVILKDEMQVADVTQRRYDFMRQVQKSYRNRERVDWNQEPPLLPDYDEFKPGGSVTPEGMIAPQGIVSGKR
jgi:general secretion pathway protein D